MQDQTEPPAARTAATKNQGHPWLRKLPLIAILCSAVLGAVLLRKELSLEALAQHHHALMAFRDAHYLLSVLSFLAAYVVIVSLSLPGALVTSLTGGFLFGLAAGTLFNVAAAGTGAIVVFLAARAGIGGALQDRLARGGGAGAKLAEQLRRNEWPMLFLIRLIPIVPFFLANLVPAMLGTRTWRFAVSTYLGIIPGAILITSVGAGLGEVFARDATPDLSLLLDPAIFAPLIGLLGLAVLALAVNSWWKRR